MMKEFCTDFRNQILGYWPRELEIKVAVLRISVKRTRKLKNIEKFKNLK